MVKEYYRPATLAEAFKLQTAASAWLAGGSSLLCTESPSVPGNRTMADVPERLIDLKLIVPAAVARENGNLVIGAGSSFQDILDSDQVFAALRAAAGSMSNRNVRNRATVGGNLADNRSCASLTPLFLAMGTSLQIASSSEVIETVPLEAWLVQPKGLVLKVIVPCPENMLAVSRHSSRTACDVATVVMAVSCRQHDGRLTDLRIVAGGFGPHAEQRSDLERLFENQTLPERPAIETAVRPLLKALDDVRGSAGFKSQLGAVLLADLLHELAARPENFSLQPSPATRIPEVRS
ncbi:MAG: FAD binding domain-containing protein [Spirochaetes bacterium]|nr:FAD binding domain-containing protein [Spirochaetota bacterium]MBU0954345.1 FAD binding domain-containing protein [Spirochaetota bacterium]